MINYDYNEIEENFKKLPPEIQIAISSPDVSNAVKNIADFHNLLVDQMGTLIDLVGYILLGLVPSKDFVREFTKEAEVSEDVARAVAEDINREVFSRIKTLARESEDSKIAIPTPITSTETKPTHVSELEKAGNFTIEHESAPIVLQRVPIFRQTNFEPPQRTPEQSIPASTPEPVSKIETPVREPVQETPTEPLPDMVPQTKPIPANTESVSTSSPSMPIVEKTEEVKVHKGPLVDELLGVLNKTEKKIPEEVKKVNKVETKPIIAAPFNLPTEDSEEKLLVEPREIEILPEVKVSKPQPIVEELKPAVVIPEQKSANNIPKPIVTTLPPKNIDTPVSPKAEVKSIFNTPKPKPEITIKPEPAPAPKAPPVKNIFIPKPIVMDVRGNLITPSVEKPIEQKVTPAPVTPEAPIKPTTPPKANNWPDAYREALD